MHARDEAVMKRSSSYSVLSLGTVLLLAACSSAPPATPAASTQIAAQAPLPGGSVGTEIAMRAMSLLGTPYKWGGASRGGFDCSGLVRFVHEQLGIYTPRTAAEQYSAARRVKISGIEPGDLLFFRTGGDKRISHVAIYTGEGRFIHAPKTGRPVELRTLDDEYYAPRLAGAGRLF
jgi:cell wall-associated NlpC family hydrolase